MHKFVAFAGVALGVFATLAVDTPFNIAMLIAFTGVVFFPLNVNISDSRFALQFSIGIVFGLFTWGAFGLTMLAVNVPAWGEAAYEKAEVWFNKHRADAAFRGTLAEASEKLRIKAINELLSNNPKGFTDFSNIGIHDSDEGHQGWPSPVDFYSNADVVTYATAFRREFLKDASLRSSWACLEFAWAEEMKRLAATNKVNFGERQALAVAGKWGKIPPFPHFDDESSVIAQLVKNESDPEARECLKKAEGIARALASVPKEKYKSRFGLCYSAYEDARLQAKPLDMTHSQACGY